MNCAVEMGSDAMIYEYIPNFLKIGSGIRKLMGGYTQMHKQYGDLISVFYFFKIRKEG
jgi:hypothetical protein